ncbi:MAG: type III pantothenate kinase [Clostridia bacterium]|nr:type III pantothenate kinase [Clostridia bacterium]
MILTLDIGNTNIKTALFDGAEMKHYWRISTSPSRSSDEYGMIMLDLFRHNGVSASDVEGIMVSSVVPTVNFTIEHMCQTYFGMQPMFVAPGIKTGIHIKYDNPKELGSDRIANAVACWELYGGPCIFIDFGTATSFGVLSAKGEFLGGAIVPGLKVTSDAIVERTAKLPRFELIKPASAIGKNTVSNLQSGILYGHIGMVKYLIKRMKDEIGSDCRVIATGGMALLVKDDAPEINVLDGLLTLKGLRLIYEKNRVED